MKIVIIYSTQPNVVPNWTEDIIKMKNTIKVNGLQCYFYILQNIYFSVPQKKISQKI